jgi:hypothetical protein
MRNLKLCFVIVLSLFGVVGLLFGQSDRLARTTASDLGAMISSMMPVSIGDSVVDSIGNMYLLDNIFTQGTGRTFSVKTKITMIPYNYTGKSGSGLPMATYDGAFSSMDAGGKAIYALRAITTVSGTTTSSSVTLVAIRPDLKLVSLNLTGRTQIRVVAGLAGAPDRIYLVQNPSVMVAGSSPVSPGRNLSFTTYSGGDSFGNLETVALP